jgi:hypothetical protein
VRALKEDVGAELDYFVFLTLLGIDDEASEFASTVLWRHLQHFPVTAEIAGYLVARDDIGELRRLGEALENRQIRFENADESLLLTCIEQIVTDKVAAAHTWHSGVARRPWVTENWGQISVSQR